MKGQFIVRYEKKNAAVRNEPLDCFVSAYSALRYLKLNLDRKTSRRMVLAQHEAAKNASRFAIEFIDPDRLDWTMNEIRNGNRIKMGVELDDQGEPVAYWIREDHPNEMLVTHGRKQRRRIPAEFIRHTFLEEQTGQTRGVSLLASAALRAHLLDQFERATVIGGIVAARKVGFYKINQEKAEDYGVLATTLRRPGKSAKTSTTTRP